MLVRWHAKVRKWQSRVGNGPVQQPVSAVSLVMPVWVATGRAR
jgi:hypothetical protein